MNSAAVAGLLEAIASERPDLLAEVVEVLEHSPARHGLAEVADVWGIQSGDRAELGAVALKASAHLDRLERRRPGTWRHPGQVVDAPNVQALASFADARRQRVAGLARTNRLGVVFRKVDRAAEVERQRRKLDAFMEQPSKPVDLAAFMGWRDA